MFYESGDDPRLLEDLQRSLKRWHSPTLGDTPLAERLPSVDRHLVFHPRSNRASALRHSIRDALSALKKRGREEHAILLERRYLREQPVPLLTGTYNLAERTLYNRLHEALVALAHQLWSLERTLAGPEPIEGAEGIGVRRWRKRNLPPPTHAAIVGGEETLATLHAWLDDAQGHWMICLDGMGGLGKTTLARETSSRMAGTNRFEDIAWISIENPEAFDRGLAAPPEPALACIQVLAEIAHQLWRIDLSGEPMSVQRERLRALLQDRPYLVIIDNLAMVDECRELLDVFWELTNPSKFLLTGRHRLQPGRYPWSVLTLKPLSRSDGLALIRSEAQSRSLTDVSQADDDTLAPIVDVVGGNPLAIKLIVGQLVSLPLGRVLQDMETVQPGSAGLYDYLYRSSWMLLSASARRLLREMIQLPSCAGTWDDLRAASSLSTDELDAALALLSKLSLLHSSGLEPRYYSVHPLTHHFVASTVDSL